MIKDRCVSVTDLRTKTKNCLANLSKHPKYVFINNRPVAVILDIQEYEDNFCETDLVELDKSQVTEDLAEKALIAVQLDESELLNI
mgnify:CR=1 FL=1